MNTLKTYEHCKIVEEISRNDIKEIHVMGSSEAQHLSDVNRIANALDEINGFMKKMTKSLKDIELNLRR